MTDIQAEQPQTAPEQHEPHAQETQAEQHPQYHYATFNARLLASFIDSAVSLIPLWIIAKIGEHIVGKAPLELVQKLSLGQMLTPEETHKLHSYMWTSVMNLSVQLAILGAVIILFWVKKAGTPGKIWLGLKIVDEKTGELPSTRQSTIRYLGYIVSTIPFFLGFLWINFNKRRRGWHDMMAGTVVIYAENSIYQRVAKRYAALLSARRG